MNPEPSHVLLAAEGQIEITVDDVNDVEARVLARFVPARTPPNGPGESIAIVGCLRGPYCATSRTLPAEYLFRPAGVGAAKVVIPDPCQWTPDLPNVYQVSVEARQGRELLATYDGPIGLHRTTPRRTGIEFPG
jgi:hypothetical protein